MLRPNHRPRASFTLPVLPAPIWEGRATARGGLYSPPQSSAFNNPDCPSPRLGSPLPRALVSTQVEMTSFLLWLPSPHLGRKWSLRPRWGEGLGVVRRTDVEPRQKNGCDSVGVSHTAVKIVRQGVSNYSLPWPSCPVAIQKSSIGAFSGPKGRHSLCRWCKPPDDCTCSPPSHQRSAASPPIAGGNRVKGNPIRCLTAPAKGVSALRA